MSEAQRFTFAGIPYRLVRSTRRKRLGLVMAATGVEVRIPQRCAERHGHQFLRDNIQWVRAQLVRADERAREIPSYLYQLGETIPWLGRAHRLQRAADPADSGVKDGVLAVFTQAREPDAAQLRPALHRLLKREALALLTDKSQELAALTGVQFCAVKVRRTKTKWGHCSLGGELQYNWLVCLAPEAVVDYLVAHEVSHLHHHNHSRAFWRQVESVCPNYRELRRWLRDNGHRLVV
ncbi:M48 family metallopeptidase [Microbulbifer sp. TYP-18]|uniref:M48 family metallopeptidase n=1 Tax=Microbulbifer sp. TYP-18 TaxID=3230024 RepID=UPI0034C5FB9E